MATDTRLTLAIGIDTARLFDSTVSQAQIDADTFPTAVEDAGDLLASLIEDAESEFYELTDDQLKIGRVGLAGQRQTYETVTYKLNGHQQYKSNFTGVTSDYLPQEVNTGLENDNVLPFDADAGDEAYLYTGLGGKTAASTETWADITDEYGETWAIKNHARGRITFDPILLFQSRLTNAQGVGVGGRNQLDELAVQLSYRYGGLGGSRSRPTRTTLTETGGIDDSQTDSVSVADGTNFPTSGSSGSVVVLIDREYLSVDPDPDTDSMDIIERGVRGTTAASHDEDARIQYTPPSVRKAVASRAGMTLVNSGRYSDWLPDTEDDLDKSDVIDSFESTWAATIDALSN
jgi:hypothetical protein